jgi:hypothetical protein
MTQIRSLQHELASALRDAQAYRTVTHAGSS